MLRAIAIDDEPPALEVIEKFSSGSPYVHLEKCFTNPEKALLYVDNFPVDLVFLDINMPFINGIRWVRSIRKEILVIFTTAYSEHAVAGFEVNAIDYLLKPIEKKRFELACKKAVDYFNLTTKHSSSNNRSLFVRSEHNLVKVSVNDITHVEKMDDYLVIHHSKEKPTLTLMTISQIQNMLPKEEFIRIHRSHLVAINRINSMKGRTIKIENFELSIGKKYLAQLRERIQH